MEDDLSNLEPTVNRWVVDYYISLALELFKNDNYEGFCDVTNVIGNIINDRQVKITDAMTKKIPVIQLLSRVNVGERLDLSFEKNDLTPLESALKVLESMRGRSDVSQTNLKKVCILVKEMIVKVFIQNEMFDRAEKTLRLFPKSKFVKKKMFMHLISQRCNKHKIIEEMDFQQFKDQILAFCLEFCQFPVPFLHQQAKTLIDKQRHRSATTDQPNNCSPSTNGCNLIIPKRKLDVSYMALAAGGDSVPFSQLEYEYENEAILAVPDNVDQSENLESEELFQRNSGSPLEAAPAAPPAQTDASPQSRTSSVRNTARKRMRASANQRQLHNIARMVMDPDSQANSLPNTAQEQEAAVRADESQAVACQTSPIAMEVTPLRRSQSDTDAMKKSRSSTSDDESSPQSEEESSISAASMQVSRGASHEQALRNGKNTDSEEMSRYSVYIVQQSPITDKSPVKKRVRNSPSKVKANKGEVTITDSSLDTSPSVNSRGCGPSKSSTPNKDPSRAKWMELYKNTTEARVTWNEEDDLLNESSDRSSVSGMKKRVKWTEEESRKLKQGVEKFGEGNWSRIKDYYKFTTRTNVNLKDRWRTMRKLKLV
ncbi:telomeric repeat binding factor a isoform X2 [Festucalex cinctus]